MRKLLCVVLISVIFSVSVFSVVEAEEMNELQNQQQEIQNQLQDANGNLEEVQNELSENFQQVQKLDEKIANSQTELSELNIKIAELQKVIDEVQSKLEVAEKNYKKQKDIVEKRLVAIYEAGEIKYLDVLLTSKSLSEFLSNYYLISELVSYDNLVLDDLQEKKEEIEKSKEKLDKAQNELATIKANQTKTAKILENTKSVRENFISKLSKEEQDIQAKIDEYTQKYQEINAEILELALQGIDTEYIGGALEWPVPGYTRITSPYGMRYHPTLHVNKLHTGVDIGAPRGADFIAANDGIVTKASFNTAYGNMVIIDHGGGVSTLYAHGDEILVQVGQVVKRGDPVLKVGSTGYSTGPHAHFEVRLNGVVTDPLPYITNGLIPESQKNEENDNAETQETNNQENTNSTSQL